MTDRQLRNAMGFDDLNQVRYDTVKCSATDRTVRVNGVRGVHERKK